MKGTLRLLVLKYLIEEKELSGTEITDKLKKGTGWEPSPGTLYPLLDKLENQGFVNSEKQGRRRNLQITQKGEQRFEEFQKDQEKYWGELIQTFKNYKEMFDQDELEDFIAVLEQAKEGNYETPYPIMISYRIIDKLHKYDRQTTEKQEKINQILERTLHEIEEELQ